MSDTIQLERTLVLFKPDAVRRNLSGELLARFERKGFKAVAMKLMRVTPELAHRHYAEHDGKPFFKGLVDFITSGPIVAVALEGRDAVAVVRKMLGKTDATQAEPGTIRGDYGLSRSLNLVHGSDSLASAERELALFFAPDEFCALTPDRVAGHYARTDEGFF